MSGTMAYLLENQTLAHSNAILETLQTWSELDPDVHLISNQGAVLQTHRVYLKLYSAVLNNALRDVSSDTIPSIFIPASTASLVNLIKILSTGVSISDQKEDLLDVVNTAELLGIFLKDIQIGTKGAPKVAPLKEDNIEQAEDANTGNVAVVKEKKKRNKRTKKKPVEKENTENVEIKQEKAEVKKEYVEVDSDISFSVNEEMTFQQEFINQGQTVKDEQVSDSSLSLSLQLDSSLETSDGDISKEMPGIDPTVNETAPSREPRACSECGKTFVNRDKLKRHFVIHTGEKPYPCDECDSKFTRKDKLDGHKNVKHNENYVKIGFECPVCNKAHGSKWHLNRHMERTHNFE